MIERTVLTKFYIINIPSHVIQYTQLPDKVIINRLVKNFIQGTIVEKRRFHLIGWKTITQRKIEGEQICGKVRSETNLSILFCMQRIQESHSVRLKKPARQVLPQEEFTYEKQSSIKILEMCNSRMEDICQCIEIDFQ